jgi:Bacterial protein of unknown function (DUF899)
LFFGLIALCVRRFDPSESNQSWGARNPIEIQSVAASVQELGTELLQQIDFQPDPLSIRQVPSRRSKNVVQVAAKAGNLRKEGRMGWRMPWYTITDTFDTDFGVDEWHGTNAFIHDAERVFRTYFINNRGDEAMGST